MDFKTFYLRLSVAEREAFAERAKTSRAVLQQVAYGTKEVDLGFADVIAAVSDHRVSIADLPLTARASVQRSIREAPRPKRRRIAHAVASA